MTAMRSSHTALVMVKAERKKLESMTKRGHSDDKGNEQVLRLYYWVMTPSRISIFGRDYGQKKTNILSAVFIPR